MLRINVIASGQQAKSYYGEQLSQGDYYVRDQAPEIAGIWQGKAATRMGLHGQVQQAEFFALAEHRNPVTGDDLTQRRKENRRVGYDLTFSASKSVSAFYAATGDQRVLAAFQEAVRETMQKDIEPNIQVRVRQGGAFEHRTTGNGLWSDFTHLTSRPVDGVPDPQMHSHVVLQNVTFDAEYQNRDGSQGAWLAADIGDIKTNGPYFQAAFHARLAGKLRDLGLSVRQSSHGYELAGFTPDMKQRFSRRTALIEARAEELGITYAADKADLGRKTREAKPKNLTWSDLQTEWQFRLTEREWRSFLSQAAAGESAPRISGDQALDYGLHHLLERRSVVRERDVLAAAMQRGVGSVLPEDLPQAITKRSDLIRVEEGGRRLLSTKAVLDEEAAMIAFARDGRGTVAPLGADSFRFRPVVRDGKRFALNAGQQQAVRHVLESHSRVILVRGAAGVGKTSLLSEAIRGIGENGRAVHVFAPTADARDVLQKDGRESQVPALQNAETVAKFLQDKQRQAGLRDQVILIDEAGLLSTRDLKQVFDVAAAQNARVILSGDYKQHASVARGDAMRILIRQAGLKPAEVTEVQRQQNTDYKQAVEALSRGTREDVVAGFDRLDALGHVREVADRTERNQQLADEYLWSVREGKTALVVSPTHAEGKQTTQAIRETLQAEGLLGDDERTVARLKNLQLTEAEKANPDSYAPGQVIQFHKPSRAVPSSTFETETVLGGGPQGWQLETRLEQDSRTTQLGYDRRGNVGLQTVQPVRKGLTWGERVEVVARDDQGTVHIRDSAGQLLELPLQEAGKFSVYERQELPLAVGDRIRITQNGYTRQTTRQRTKLERKHRLSNGAMYTVRGFTADEHLQLDNGWIVDRDFGHLAHGYVTTSHAAQGKTVDRVVVAMSSESFPASSMQQFYVSASRARESVTIYTDDKQALRNDAILRSGERMAATELAAKSATPSERAAEHERVERQRTFRQRLADLGRQAAAAAHRKVKQVREYYGKQRDQSQHNDRGLAYE